MMFPEMEPHAATPKLNDGDDNIVDLSAAPQKLEDAI
jgi:hypothetical protein